MDSILSGFLPDGSSISSLIPAFRLTDFLDIVGVAVLIYLLISWVRKTRAWVLFRGIAIVLVVWLIAVVAQLNMMMWIFQNVFNIGILAIVVIFQPELRRALEKLGTNNVFTNMFSVGNINAVNERTAESITRAMVSMAEVKTGALICVERQVALGEYEQTGIPLNADVTSQLLINIFEKNTPLHDGAVIIRQNRVLAATCYLFLKYPMPRFSLFRRRQEPCPWLSADRSTAISLRSRSKKSFWVKAWRTGTETAPGP